MHLVRPCGIGLPLVSLVCFVMWAACLQGQQLGTGRVEVAVGAGHGVLLKNDGTVWTWGANDLGQLGRDGDDSGAPVQVPGLSGVHDIAADSDFTMALKADGSVWTWGGNARGQLGNGGTDPSHIPAQVRGLPHILAIAAGGAAAMALDSNGTVWGWGYGFGSKPERVQKLPNITAIAAGDVHFIALDSKGQVWVWGLHGIEQIHGGTSSDPQQVPDLSDIIAVAGGHQSTFGLKKDGTVWATGSGYAWLKSKPTMVIGLSGVKAIAARDLSVLALKDNGTVWAWGGNLNGELGNPAVHSESSIKPVRVGTMTGITAIASGGGHSAAVTGQGVVWAWGRNSGGVLGTAPEVLARSDVAVRVGRQAIPPKQCVLAPSEDEQRELFGCETANGNGKFIQICGDPDPEDAEKYKNINYRFGPDNGPPDLMFPAHPESAPPSLFYSTEKGKGSDGRDLEVIRFSNGAYTYRVYFGYVTTYYPDGRLNLHSQLDGGVEVYDRNGKRLSRIACGAAHLSGDLSRSLPPDPKKAAGRR